MTLYDLFFYACKNIYSFQLNNLNIVVNEQSQDQAAEDRLIELEEKKSMHVFFNI